MRNLKMSAPLPIKVPSTRRESTFLDLAPTQSTPPSLPVSTKAVASPTEGSAPSISSVIEPLKKIERSGSDSSDISVKASGTTFLMLNHTNDE